MSEVCDGCKAKLRKNLEESPIAQLLKPEELDVVFNELIEGINKTVPRGPYDPIE